MTLPYIYVYKDAFVNCVIFVQVSVFDIDDGRLFRGLICSSHSQVSGHCQQIMKVDSIEIQDCGFDKSSGTTLHCPGCKSPIQFDLMLSCRSSQTLEILWIRSSLFHRQARHRPQRLSFLRHSRICETRWTSIWRRHKAPWERTGAKRDCLPGTPFPRSSQSCKGGISWRRNMRRLILLSPFILKKRSPEKPNHTWGLDILHSSDDVE